MQKKKQTPLGLISKAVFSDLRKAGWSAGRDEEQIVNKFCQLLGSQWVPAAGPFIRSLGGLSFYGKLWAWGNPLWDEDLIVLQRRISDVVGSRVVPVASSSCMSEGCVVWIDECGRFYAANSGGMIFMGSCLAEFLEESLGGGLPLEPPPELREKLINGYEWIEE